MSKLHEAPSEHPASGAPARPVVLVELIATVALTLSTLIAATVVSIGIARADIAGADLQMLAGFDTAPFALAWLFGLLLAGTGGVAALRVGKRG